MRKFAILGASSLVLLLAGCSREELTGIGFESNTSSVNEQAFGLWQGAWLAAAIVGAFTLVLILWPAIFHRKKDESFPRQFQYNVPAEIAYTVIPFLIIAVLFGYTARAQNQITAVSPASATEVHDVTVNAFQWSWQFTYEEAGPGTTVTGSPAQPPVLYMPQGERVRFKITASDVVHGFWVPAFMIQIQNLPGVENQLEFTANELGEYPGRCNILCGRQHAQMLFTVKVVTPAEYDAYIASLKAGANT
ncbi:MAG: cytochrome c oxidase subunit [Actinomycetota bacterium]|jgi:cytochrome c oxidase subunit 2